MNPRSPLRDGIPISLVLIELMKRQLGNPKLKSLNSTPGTDIFMSFQMPLHAAFLVKISTTYAACVRFFSSMNSNMSDQSLLQILHLLSYFLVLKIPSGFWVVSK